jgi:Na+/H+ antiporter NhaD/arsenite permease-like protein
VLLAIARRPQSWSSAVLAATAGALAGPSFAMRAAVAAVPLLVFLTAALAVAFLAQRLGLAARAADVLAHAARGRALTLYWLTCALAAFLTALVSLDGAIVLMLPVILFLARRFGAPFRPLLAGTIAVVNAFSAGLPEGNPTNLVVMQRLGIGPLQFVRWMFAPACAATLLCALLVAVRERRALAVSLAPRHEQGGAGLQRSGKLFYVPLRIALQVGGLLALVLELRTGLGLDRLAYGGSLAVLLSVGLAVAAAASAANNLPVSTAVAGLLAPGPTAYAAFSGLAAGSLATPHGSAATLIANELSGGRFGRDLRLWLPTAAAGTAMAAAVLWLVGA